MKITEKEIKELVREAVKQKLKNIKAASLQESSDFTAKRQIIHSAGQTAMGFEAEILKLMNIQSPDELPVHLQQKYLEIAEDMKRKMISAVEEAVNRLSLFPRTDDGSKGNG